MLRNDGQPGNTTMRHRHLNHDNLTMAAIDDVIGRGQLSAWKVLRLALLHQPRVRDKVLRVCGARISDPCAQRYHFWKHYAEAHPAAS